MTARFDRLDLGLFALGLLGLVLWDTAEGWLVEASPAWFDAVLGGLLLVGTAALGLVGVRSDRTGGWERTGRTTATAPPVA